jgi:ABC-2 type transport system permease protein
MSREDRIDHLGQQSRLPVDDPSGGKTGRYARFIWAYAKANLAMEMEYRASFIVRAFGMILNDLMWMTFWVLYFERFPVVQGWRKADVLALWCLCELGFGLAHTVFGNALRLSGLVVRGDLDFYLVYPKDPLLHLLVSRSNATAVGDLLLGPIAFVVLVRPTLWQFAVFMAAGTLVAGIFLGFTVLAQSLAFFIGNSESLSDQVTNSLIHFATYPAAIFHGGIKAVLFTLIPAGFINTIPVRVVREFDPVFFGLTALAATVFVVGGWLVFRAGLRRYESGNLMQVRM